MKISKSKQILEKHRYHISSDIKVDVHFKNGKETRREFIYTGKKVGGYQVSLLYKFARNILEKKNPFHGDWGSFKNTVPTDIESIDIKDFILCQSASHSFYEMDFSPIPVVYNADYYNNGNLNNKYYDLEKMRDHLLKHPNVIECSDILDIPYYNRDDYEDSEEEGRTKYLSIKVFPKKDWLIDMKESNSIGYEFITGQPWDKTNDYLNIHQFCKREKY